MDNKEQKGQKSNQHTILVTKELEAITNKKRQRSNQHLCLITYITISNIYCQAIFPFILHQLLILH